MTKTKKVTANALTKQTIKILSLHGFNVWRQNNGGVYDPTKKAFRRNSSTPGVPDVIGYDKKTGVFVCAEIKAGKDKLSIFQERFINDVIRAGGSAFVIRTVDDIDYLHNILKEKKYKA